TRMGVIFLYFFLIPSAKANAVTDSLKQLLLTPTADTLRVNRLLGLSFELQNIDPRQTIDYGREALALSQRLHYGEGEAKSLGRIGLGFRSLDQYDSALYYLFRGLALRREQQNKKGIANACSNIGLVYKNLSRYDSAALYYHEALQLAKETGDS